jgi:hypothetical protein
LAVTPADQDQAFLREVDENLRADQLAEFGRKYGKLILGAIIAGLVALGAFLWWQHHQENVAGEQGETLQTAFEKLGAGDVKGAEAPLAELSTSKVDGYRVAALMSQAAVLAEKNDLKGAAAKFAQVATDASLAKPYRDLALVKQTMLEFDTIAPELVVARMKPLAVKENAFFGSAGELLALAQLRQGKKAEAGQMFGAIAKDPAVPETIRQRVVQMAGVLGVDAVDQGEGGKRK